MSESDSGRDINAVSQVRYQLHQCEKNNMFTKRYSRHTSLHTHAGQTCCHRTAVRTTCTLTLFNNQRRMNQQRTPTPETQDKVKVNLPAHSQERCTQKACHPPSLQRLCNVTVEEKTRTLLKGFPRGLSQEKFYSRFQGCFCLDPRSAQETMGV